jgi:hypothetical protein
MQDAIGGVFREIPWFRPLLAWALATGIIVLILTGPAYFIFFPIIHRLRTEFGQFLNRLAVQNQRATEQRQRAIDQAAAEFADDHLLQHLDTSTSTMWSHLMSELSAKLGTASGTVGALFDNVAALRKALPDLSHNLSGLPFDGSSATTVDLPKAFAQVGSQRVALMQALVNSVILIGVLFLNTGMLSQILRDLGYIPQSLQFAGMPLYYLLAFVIAVLEAGFGFAHGIFSDREEGDSRIQIGAVLVALASVCIGVVEGFFYSRMLPDRQLTVTIPFVNYSMAQTDVLFMQGFLLVMGLFVFGLVLYQAMTKLLRGTALGALRRKLKALAKSAALLADSVQAAEGALQRANAHGHQDGGSRSGLLDALRELNDKVTALEREPPTWVANQESRLRKQTVLSMLQSVEIWSAMALLGMIGAVVVGYAMFSRATRVHDPLLHWGGGAAVAMLSFGAGFLLSLNEIVVRGDRYPKPLFRAPMLSRVIGGLLIAIEEFFLFALMISRSETVQVPYVFLVLFTGLLFAAGYFLGPQIGLVRLLTLKGANTLAFAVERIGLLLGRLIWGPVLVLDYLAWAFASPLVVVLGPPRSLRLGKPALETDEVAHREENLRRPPEGEVAVPVHLNDHDVVG